MAKYALKLGEIEAICHPGPQKIQVVGKKGEQTASKGDYIVFWGPTAHEREVFPAAEFEERYELVDPMLKSSGIEGDAGDWTSHGNGFDYPTSIIESITGADMSKKVGGETVLDEDAVANLAAGDDKQHEQVTSSTAPSEPEKAEGGTEGHDERATGTQEDDKKD